jgi:uncharacterized protein with beta-barrel porin domain
MMNKAINTLVLATVDSLKKFKNKLAYYLAIFAMVFGSTFGTMNAANSAAITLNATTAAGPGTMKTAGGDVAMAVDGTDTLNIVSFATTLTLADDAANQIFGAITGTTGTLTLTTAEDSHASSQTVASYVGVDGDVQITTAGDQDHTVIFTGDVSTGAITGIITIDGDAGDATATLVQVGGDITGVVKMDKNSGTATLELTGTNATINQSVDGLGDAEGRLKISGAGATMAGKVGTTGTTSLALIDVDATATFADTSEATTYTVDADTTFTGAVLANTAFTVDTAGTDVTLTAASDLSLATVTLGTLTSNGLLTTSDLINTAGKVYLNVKNNEMGTGRYAAGDGAELHVGKAFVTTDVISIGDDANGGATDFHAGSKIYLPSNFSNGETLKMTDSGAWDATSGDAATAAAAITVTLQDTALVDFTATAAIGDTDIVITATDKSAATIATELGVTSDTVKATLQLMTAMDANDTTGDTAAYDAYDNALNARGFTATEDTAFVNQVAPQTDTIGGSAVATRAMTGTVQGIVSNRMASLRSGDAYATGMSAGNGMSANSGFIQAFGSESEQKTTKSKGASIFGFDSDTSGVAIGFDGMTDDGSTLGLSASYSTTDVDGKGTGKSKNAIDSYTVSVYADKATENGYLEGSLTYGINDNNASRLVDVSGLDRTYSANYDSSQISLKVGGGVPNEVIDGTFVTPFASATATTISTDAYTEKSTTADDALRLKVAQDDINSLVATVGVKAHMVTDKGTPMISLALNNEFGDNQINSNNTYQGGGTKFKTTTDLEELSATLGLGYSFGNDATSLNFNYEANANDDEYVSHYGSVKIIAKF